MADILYLPVSRAQTIETSSLGAAMSAYIAMGTYTVKEAKENMFRETKVFEPNPENKKTYDDLYQNAYSKLYGSLSDIYAFLFKFNDK